MFKQLSFIIPVYNCKKYLRRCINSIISTANNQVELILVDDGSTDGSAEICDEYAAQSFFDIPVKVIHQTNAGGAKARINGLKKSIGKYIIFVDADDYIDAQFISTALSDIQQHPADVILYRHQEEDTSAHSSTIIDSKILDKDALIRESFLLHTAISKACNVRTVWAKMINRSIINTKLFDNFPRVEIGEDMLMMLDIYSRANTLYFHNIVAYHYFFHTANSITNRYKPNMLEIILHQEMLFQQWLSHEANAKYAPLYAFYRLNDIVLCMKFDFFHECNKETSQQRRIRFYRVLKSINYTEFYKQAQKNNLLNKAPYGKRLTFWLAAHHFYAPLAFLAKIRYGNIRHATL